MPAHRYDTPAATSAAIRETEVVTSVLMQSLAAMLDPFSINRLEAEGVPDDARCLVLGVGASRVAAWLADLAGRGEVVATDIDHTHTVHHHRVQQVTHRLGEDRLPAGRWDVIHARLLLNQLPDRHTLLAELAATLAPDGIVVVEEITDGGGVLAAPPLYSAGADPVEAGWADADRLHRAYQRAFQAVRADAGLDPVWARRVHDGMRRLGLDADTVGHARTWAGNSPGTRVLWATAVLARDQLVRHGMPPADIDAFRALLADPELRVLGATVLSTIGRRT